MNDELQVLSERCNLKLNCVSVFGFLPTHMMFNQTLTISVWSGNAVIDTTSL